MVGPFISFGGGFGAIGGMVAGAYFYRDARRQYAVYDQIDQMKDLRYIILFKQYKESRKKALCAVTMGPLAGIVGGASLYGAKRAASEFLFADAKTQRNVMVLFAVAMAAMTGKMFYEKNKVH